jgi:flagellar M-ring protein FliF
MAKEGAKYIFGLILLFIFFQRILKPLMQPVFRTVNELAKPPQPVPVPRQLDGMGGGSANPQNADYIQKLDMAKRLAKDDPKMVANVVKTWVSE